MNVIDWPVSQLAFRDLPICACAKLPSFCTKLLRQLSSPSFFSATKPTINSCTSTHVRQSHGLSTNCVRYGYCSINLLTQISSHSAVYNLIEHDCGAARHTF